MSSFELLALPIELIELTAKLAGLRDAVTLGATCQHLRNLKRVTDVMFVEDVQGSGSESGKLFIAMLKSWRPADDVATQQRLLKRLDVAFSTAGVCGLSSLSVRTLALIIARFAPEVLLNDFTDRNGHIKDFFIANPDSARRALLRNKNTGVKLWTFEFYSGHR